MAFPLMTIPGAIWLITSAVTFTVPLAVVGYVGLRFLSPKKK